MKTFIPITLFAIFLVFSSCYKQSKPIATLTIVDVAGAPIYHAAVNINSTSHVVSSIYVHTYYSSAKGEVPFGTENECILQADVTNKNLKTTELFQMKFDEVTLKTIVLK